MRRLLLLLLVCVTVASCTEAQPQADGADSAVIGGVPASPQQVQTDPGPRALSVDSLRDDDGVIVAAGENAQYNYGPSVMAEGGLIRMWWCSQLVSAAPPGDDVVYAEAPAPIGPYSIPRAVFGGTGAGFDGRHTCDPSVIKVNGTYYMYYTGAPTDHSNGNAIGLATSPDGLTWTRAKGGQPVVTSSFEVGRSNTYGAGQPSALFLDGWFYLMFTDTYGRGAHDNGAGQFVLRSQDPAFVTHVEMLTAKGFVPGHGRERSIVDAFSADWMWIDALDAFAIGHETDGGTTLTFWDRDFTRHPYQPVLVHGPWEEGPGLAKRPDGHAPINATDPCGRVSVDLVRATRNRAEPTDLRRFGLDLKDVGGCATRNSAMATLNGFAMPSPQRTMDLVLDNAVYRVDRRSVAMAFGANVVDKRPAVLNNMAPAAHVVAGAEAIQATGRGVGLLLAGKLYPIGSAEVAGVNSSQVVEVLPATWDRYLRGPALAVSR